MPYNPLLHENSHCPATSCCDTTAGQNFLYFTPVKKEGLAPDTKHVLLCTQCCLPWRTMCSIVSGALPTCGRVGPPRYVPRAAVEDDGWRAMCSDRKVRVCIRVDINFTCSLPALLLKVCMPAIFSLTYVGCQSGQKRGRSDHGLHRWPSALHWWPSKQHWRIAVLH